MGINDGSKKKMLDMNMISVGDLSFNFQNYIRGIKGFVTSLK